MPRPDWRHMPASAWRGPEGPRQDALFDPPGTDEDDFGTLPFEGCATDELASFQTPDIHVDR
ncbi:hypothetical protein [Kitasatospora cineracea]|uniref:hypothetical protein n=1 Tax=Kitasatospora cineracea TaxID=88074 RepID=UPI0036759E40